MENSTPIIFLDLDGPIVTDQMACQSNNNKWGATKFDKDNVMVLNKILKLSDAEIIISSDWRHHYYLEELKQIFEYFGVIKKPIGVTCNFSKQFTSLDLEGARSAEIIEWLKTNGSNRKWVAIDDLLLTVPNFIHIKRTKEGIKQTGLKDKILKFLV